MSENRIGVLIESARNPKGNVGSIGSKLETVLERVTNPEASVDGASLGLVHGGLSHLVGSLAKQVIAGWAGQPVNVALVREILYEIMVQCILLLEALDTTT